MTATSMKILLCASHHQLAIGYSRVACAILNHLADQGYDMVHFAFSNFEPHENIDRYLDPSVKIIDTFNVRRAEKTDAMAEEHMKTDKKLLDELKKPADVERFKVIFGMQHYDYGGEMLAKTIETERPDMVFVYNDVLVVRNMLSRILRGDQRPKVVVYLDIVLPQQHTDQLKYIFANCDHVLAFSKVWRDELIERGFPQDQISVLRHGIDPPVLTDRRTARKKLKINGKRIVDLEDFVILNSNRNQHRKLWDVSIFAFLEFLKRARFDPRVKFVANTEMTNGGYDLMKLIETGIQLVGIEGTVQQALKHFVFTHHISDEQMQLMYDVCDVGINTCTGEGVGLCSLEHAAHGKPQVVTRAGGLIDIFMKNHNECLIEPKVGIYSPKNLDGHGGIQNMCDYRDFATRLMELYLDYSQLEFKVNRWLWPRALRGLGITLQNVARRRVFDVVWHVDRRMQAARMEMLRSAVDVFAVVVKSKKRKRAIDGVLTVSDIGDLAIGPNDVVIYGDPRAIMTPDVITEVRHMMCNTVDRRFGSVVPLLSNDMKATKGTVKGPTFSLGRADAAGALKRVHGVGWFLGAQNAARGDTRHDVPPPLAALAALR